MASLLTALQTSAAAMQTFEQALETIGNNVSNSSTPGYADQSVALEALPFQPSQGLPGGVAVGAIQSARSEFAEQNVRQQVSQMGTAESTSQGLSSIQTNFTVSSDQGVAGSLNQLFSNFSSWGVSPTSNASQQTVIDSANGVAKSFQQAYASLSQNLTNTGQQIQAGVTQINSFASQLAADNQQIQNGDRQDAGLDASIHSTLESLSEYTNITARQESNGTWTVLAGGQTPLVMGTQTDQLHVSFSTAPGDPATVPGGAPPARIIDAQGKDVTGQVSQGTLAGQLQVYNTVLPSFIGGAYQQGGLNVLAQGVADTVNTIFTSGNISDGPPPVTGIPLFTYNAAAPSAIASTLGVNPAVTPGQLAAIQPGPPEVSNGIPLQLAALASPTTPTGQINGFSFTGYYGSLAAQVGQQASASQNQLQVQQQTVAQARSLRGQISDVSLNDEAARLLQFQNAYQATARTVNVLDQLTLDTINMLPLS
jgi:flagellar hook-associated protein 1 FlgK